jgi:hypothetical protein
VSSADVTSDLFEEATFRLAPGGAFDRSHGNALSACVA